MSQFEIMYGMHPWTVVLTAWLTWISMYRRWSWFGISDICTEVLDVNACAGLLTLLNAWHNQPVKRTYNFSLVCDQSRNLFLLLFWIFSWSLYCSYSSDCMLLQKRRLLSKKSLFYQNTQRWWSLPVTVDHLSIPWKHPLLGKWYVPTYSRSAV